MRKNEISPNPAQKVFLVKCDDFISLKKRIHAMNFQITFWEGEWGVWKNIPRDAFSWIWIPQIRVFFKYCFTPPGQHADIWAHWSLCLQNFIVDHRHGYKCTKTSQTHINHGFHNFQMYLNITNPSSFWEICSHCLLQPTEVWPHWIWGTRDRKFRVCVWVRGRLQEKCCNSTERRDHQLCETRIWKSVENRSF